MYVCHMNHNFLLQYFVALFCRRLCAPRYLDDAAVCHQLVLLGSFSVISFEHFEFSINPPLVDDGRDLDLFCLVFWGIMLNCVRVSSKNREHLQPFKKCKLKNSTPAGRFGAGFFKILLLML